jgi:predicted DNA-binding transcriptional regulator AlpA
MEPVGSTAPRSVADVIEAFSRLMKAKELAPLLGHKEKTLYAKAASGSIPSVKLCGSLLFDSYVIATWLRKKAA